MSFAPDAGPDTRDYRVDFTKITEQLPSYQPQWSIPLGIEQLAGDMRRYHLTVEDFTGSRFVRLEQIRLLMGVGALDDHLRLTAVTA